MDEVIQRIPGVEEIVIGGDMNKINNIYIIYMEGMDLVSEMMQEKKVLDFATAYDLAIVNTYFRKREKHYVTYKSGRNKSQIDYFMVRRGNAKQCKDCKVIP